MDRWIVVAVLALCWCSSAVASPVHTPATLQRVLSIHPSAAAGTRVRVRGRITRRQGKGPTCTRRRCLKQAPCCNACVESLYLEGPKKKHFLRLEGKYKGRWIGCWGSSCGVRCFPQRFNFQYIIDGRLVQHSKGSRRSLASYSLIPLRVKFIPPEKPYPLKVRALTSDNVGIRKARVYVNGKFVGETGRKGLYVGVVRGREGSQVRVRVKGYGRGNVFASTHTLTMKGSGAQRKPALIEIDAYLRPF